MNCDDNNWMLELNAMSSNLGKMRQEFVNQVTRYDRQSIYSNYITEDELIEQLIKIRDLRKKVHKFSKDHYPDTKRVPYKI